jgi:hypothetical protein
MPERRIAGEELFPGGGPLFLSRDWRVVQERERLLGFLKASRIQLFISFSSARIQASPSRISLSSFSMFPAFIFPAWRRNEVEFGRFIAFEVNRVIEHI